MATTICPYCGGTGWSLDTTDPAIERPCPHCDGTGKIQAVETADVEYPRLAISQEPLLGLATTEQLMRELICRLRSDTFTVDRALVLAEMLGGLNAAQREYRTADG